MLPVIEVWEVKEDILMQHRTESTRVYIDLATAESAIQDEEAHFSYLGIPTSQKSLVRRFAIRDPSGKVHLLTTTQAVIASPK